MAYSFGHILRRSNDLEEVEFKKSMKEASGGGIDKGRFENGSCTLLIKLNCWS